MRRTLTLLAIGAGLVAIAAAMVSTSFQAQREHIVVTTVSVEHSIEDLTRGATVVAIVEPTGRDRVHWNSADNTRWESDRPGATMIYNDQEVRVVKVLQGTITSPTLTVRNIGGVVGDVEYRIEGLDPLMKGRSYLLFLREFETPTREGTERAWSFVAQEQGVFALSETGYANARGLVASEALIP